MFIIDGFLFYLNLFSQLFFFSFFFLFPSIFCISHRLRFLHCVLLLAAVMFLRIDTHQGGSRIPRLSILLFFSSSFSSFFAFFSLFYCPSSLYHLIHTIQIRTCIHIHRLFFCVVFFSFKIHLYYVDKRRTSAFL